jgi:hypothetical protein
MHHIYVGSKTQWNTLKTVEQHRMGEKGEEVQWKRIDWLKHNIFIGKTARHKSHWTMNRPLNSEGQECKTGHAIFVNSSIDHILQKE